MSPFHGMLQVVEVPGGIAESVDGLRWKLYVCDEGFVSHAGPPWPGCCPKRPGSRRRACGWSADRSQAFSRSPDSARGSPVTGSQSRRTRMGAQQTMQSSTKV